VRSHGLVARSTRGRRMCLPPWVGDRFAFGGYFYSRPRRRLRNQSSSSSWRLSIDELDRHLGGTPSLPHVRGGRSVVSNLSAGFSSLRMGLRREGSNATLRSTGSNKSAKTSVSATDSQNSERT
jgi:hypothetical protein